MRAEAETSTAALISAQLRFDLAGFFFSTLHSSATRLNQVENEEEGRAIFLPGPGALSVARVDLLSLRKTPVPHWFCFICPGFVVTHGNTVKALSGAVSRRGKSLGSPGVNPIVFSPM